jgi:DNA polymerase sigma
MALLKDLYYDIILELTGPMTTRSLENASRALESIYVKSTAQGATPEEQAALTPSLIAQVLETAKQDNAIMIAAWGKAIYEAVSLEDVRFDNPISDLKRRLVYARDQERFFRNELYEIDKGISYPTFSTEEREQQTTIAQRALRQAQEDISQLEQDLRDLQEPKAQIFRYPSYQGPVGPEPVGHGHLDGDLP